MKGRVLLGSVFNGAIGSIGWSSSFPGDGLMCEGDGSLSAGLSGESSAGEARFIPDASPPDGYI